ncbi:expressed unknown protein [Seminavis robusta]|uniref:Uncharacterized protein n=1 Tax=Seminavis robusta TaxID=568900 RepID=A0A9N8HC16_9STRA|nr:expressed unknown protein [Seminavis robusta]|eukprot:Sro203_g085620.1 n/a (224) ;mRNA; r:59367-60117
MLPVQENTVVVLFLNLLLKSLALAFSVSNKYSDQLAPISEHLILSGELTSDMASKLPNWFSSKEGLTGESPAVFGGCGMELIQAGKSLAPPEEESETIHDFDSSIVTLVEALQVCSADLAAAACTLDPIGIGEEMDMACEAVLDLASCLQKEDSPAAVQASQEAVHEAFQKCCDSFRDYGDLLLAEDSNKGESAAGNILSRAGDELGKAGTLFQTLVLCSQKD